MGHTTMHSRLRRLLTLIPRAATRVGTLALAGTLFASSAFAQDGIVKRWAPNEPASTFGHTFDDLFWLITILVSVSFAIVLLMLFTTVLRDRAKPGKKAHFDHGKSLHDKRFTAVVSVTVFIVLDAWVLYIAMHDLREGHWNIPEKDQPGVYQVEVLAQQWAWNFRTPGIDGEFGTADDIVTINDLHVPVDRPIKFNMTSKDVIHSFFVPDMRVKRDLNPGAINLLWFQAIRTGTFDLPCAELCGYAHYQMAGRIHVLAESEFEAWEQEASTLAELGYDAEDTEAHWAWEWKD